MSYTRTFNIRSEVERVRSRLGRMVNLSISVPATMEHTLPKIHSQETVEKVQRLCSMTPKDVWEADLSHTHQYCPRASDVRTIVVHAATPCDFLAATKECLFLVQKYPKQVCVRVCTVQGGANPLPIYDAASRQYTSCQFEPKTESPEPVDASAGTVRRDGLSGQ